MRVSPTGAEFDEPHDLPSGGVGANARRLDRDLTLARHRGCKGRLADAARDRQAFAGDRLLVDHGEALDDLAVDGNHLARVDDHMIADLHVARGDRHDAAIAQDPGRLRLELEEIADGALRAGGGEIADPIAELDEPGDERASEMIALSERSDDRQRVEKVDVQSALVTDDAKGPCGDGIAVPEHQRNVDRHRTRIGEKGETQRDCWQQQWMPLRLLGRLDLGDELLGQMLAMIETRRGELRQFADVLERHQPHLSEQQAEHRLVLDVVLDDQARAGEIDARRNHSALGAKPRQQRLGKRALIAKRGDGEAHAPRHEMAYRKLHEKRLFSLRSRSVRAESPERRKRDRF